MHEVVALVLSGGGGERLSVLSAERAVSAIPFGGKYRIIDFVLSNCCHSEIDRVGVLTQHAPTSLHDHIGAGRPWDLDRRDRGVMVLQPFVTRGTAGWYRGTADAIAQNWDVIEELDTTRVLVLSGDHVYRMDYRPLLAAHEAMGADVTLGVTCVSSDQAHRFGMVTVDSARRVTGLVEKPERSDSPFASMGIYVFETRTLARLLRGGHVDLVAGVIEPLVGSGAAAFEFEGYWEDVGTIRSYHRASLDLVAEHPRFALDDRRWPILTRDEERPPVVVKDGARIEQSLISNGCRIAGTVRRSILSPGVVVEPEAVIEDSVVFSDSVIEGGAQVRRSIVDKFTRIGAGARLGGRARNGAGPPWLEGLVLVGKDARVPGSAEIEPGVVIGAGALPEDFSGGPLPSGAQIANRTRYGIVS